MIKTLTPLSNVIAEISMGPFGSDIKVENFVKVGVPVLNGSNLTATKLVEDSFKYVSEEKAKTYKKAIARRGDVIITHRGTLGQVSYIPNNSKYERYVISQSQFRVRFKDDLVSPEFVTYYFSTTEGQKRLLSFKNHVGVPALAQATTNFRKLSIPLPDIFTQKKIVELLESLDSKIEINNKINDELEKMIKLVYDYWFVQFDFPDENGKPYKSSGGELVWNEELKREIPKGWSVKRLDLLEPNIVTGKTPPTADPENFQGLVPFICIGDLRQGMHIVKTEMNLSEKGANLQKNKFIPSGAICVSCIASPGLVALSTKKSQTNQQLNSVIISQEQNRYFLYFYLKDYFKYSRAKTGNTFANMNKEDFSSIKIIASSNELLSSFSKIVEPLGSTILSNLHENEELSSLRDWLLPMLMNGQARIN